MCETLEIEEYKDKSRVEGLSFVKDGNISFNDIKTCINSTRSKLKGTQDPYVTIPFEGELQQVPSIESVSSMAKLYEQYCVDGKIDVELMEQKLKQSKPQLIDIFSKLLKPCWTK